MLSKTLEIWLQGRVAAASIGLESMSKVRSMTDAAIHREFQGTPIGSHRDMVLRFEMVRWAKGQNP